LLRQQAEIVGSDLFHVNSAGKIKFNMDTLTNLKSVILPFLTDTLKSIPIPKMTSCNESREFSLDNIVLRGFDIIPENIRFHIDSDPELSIKDKETKGSKTHLVISLDNLRTELKDMKFCFKKKTFPEISDRGLVTLRIGGEGAVLNINFTMVQNPGETKPQFIEGSANLNIRNQLEIEFDKSTLKHHLLVPMMTSLFKQQIQQVIERIVQNNLSRVIQRLGQRLTQSLGDLNSPFFNGLEKASQALKKNQGKTSTIVCKKQKNASTDKVDSRRLSKPTV